MCAQLRLGFKAVLVSASLFALVQVPGAEAIQSQEDQPPTIRTTTSEVLLDFVVRDKNAKIIRNLRPEEIQVFEDGVPQTLRHFEFVNGRVEAQAPVPSAPATAAAPTPVPAAVAPSNAAPPPPTINEVRDMSVVTVVIGNLDPRGSEATLNAMRDFAKSDLGPNTYVGVFRLGEGGLRNLQPYTNDAAKISAAIETAVRQALAGDFGAIDASSMDLGGMGAVSNMANPVPQLPLIGSTGIKGGGPGGDVAAMSSAWNNELHDVYLGSMQYLSPLRSLVDSQAQVPGRKVMLLFSAGILVHPDTVEFLHSIISAANRANVSIYALDTKGQPTDQGQAEHGGQPSTDPTQSDLDDARRRVAAAATLSMNQQLDRGSAAVSPDEVVAMEVAESSIHSNTRGNMQELAEGTGGALLPDTLDLREPIRDAIESARTHYEATYATTNATLDGNFRRIEVKVTRPGATVFARSGYYAVPLINGHQVYPFEVATLKAINTKPDLHQFDFNTMTPEFRPGAVRNQYAFIFQAPTKDLTVTTDDKWAKVHVCVTALIKDSRGQIVDKISKDIPYDLPIAMKTQMEKGTVSFTAPFFLAPGHYTIDTAAVDRQSMKASVSRSVLDVDQDSGFSVSDVSVVRRVDDIHGQANVFDPFESRGGTVTPELSNNLQPDASGNVKFYAVAYPPAPVDEPVVMKVEVMQDDKLVAQSPVYQVTLDSNGVATMLASVPAAKLPAGQYEADVLFQYKGEKLMKKVEFTLTGSGVASN
jgi:VWFA-related protein